MYIFIVIPLINMTVKPYELTNIEVDGFIIGFIELSIDQTLLILHKAAWMGNIIEYLVCFR